MKKTFNFELPTGDKVKVEYNSRYFHEENICLHLEFYGNIISETGYRSHFFGYPLNPIEPKIEEIEVITKELIEEWSGIKFGQTAQIKMFI